MLYPILTYSRNLGDFSFDLAGLHKCGLKGIRLIYKGKSLSDFNLRIEEIQEQISTHCLNMDILIDLPGSKPTVGNLNEGLGIQRGIIYQLVDEQTITSPTQIPTVSFYSQEQFLTLASGDIISVADDELNFLVKEIEEGSVVCEALNSFHLTSNRSISVKNKPFGFSANSERDLTFVKSLQHLPGNVKLLVSFAKNADDILKLRALQPRIDIIPKIETVLDDAALMGIMDHCQTLMVGRGDLSTSAQPNELFTFQKCLIDLCRTRNKQLIIGTGLLAGIGENNAPTIAEVMDYGYLRSMGIVGFLIAGTNAHNKPFETLEFMIGFER